MKGVLTPISPISLLNRPRTGSSRATHSPIAHSANRLCSPSCLRPSVWCQIPSNAMIRWLDFNDTWLAAEWGHPSDNLGSILAVADYSAGRGEGGAADGARRAHGDDQGPRIQGVLALENGFNRVGLDHVLLVRVASTAVVDRACSAAPARSSTRCPMPGSTAARCAPIGMPQYRIAQELGRGDATSRRCATRCSRSRARWATRRRCLRKTWGFQDVLFGQAVAAAAAVRQLRHGKRPVENTPIGPNPRPI